MIMTATTTHRDVLATSSNLSALDRAHVWHPFTPMTLWREQDPLIIDRADGEYLIDTQGNRYLDGVSSLWCNVHGHRVPQIDQAIRDQLDKVAHTTLLGLASPPSIELAAMLAERTPGPLNKVFYTDAGATALEVAFKMAVGYWHHSSKPDKNQFVAFTGAYHGDTTGSMSVGFSKVFHTPFLPMLFPVHFAPAPAPGSAYRDTPSRHTTPGSAYRDTPSRHTTPGSIPPGSTPAAASQSHSENTPHGQTKKTNGMDRWPSQDPAITDPIKRHCLAELDKLLAQQHHRLAAIVIEPIMQGAAGMICQPPGFLRGVAELAKKYDVLLIADEVATGFGRTGRMFACEHENVQPDIMCLAKGITGGYLPLAATVATDAIEQAFCGPPDQHRTLYHGHTYTGNPLACAAAVASLKLSDDNDLLAHINASADIIASRLATLHDCPNILDIRQRGIMVGIELCQDRATQTLFDPAKRTAAALCLAMREKGLILRPLGDVLILMPIPAMRHDALHRMLDIVIDAVRSLA